MGCFFSKKNRDYHASERGYTERDEVYSLPSGSCMHGSGNGDSRTLNRSYPTSNWSSTPSSPSREGYSAGGGKTKGCAVNILIATYVAKGGGKVAISVPLNPWEVLGLQSSSVSREAVKAAFKGKITQPVRQNRAMVSIANHILTSTAGRYTRVQGKDEFVLERRDHFMLAACGHTEALTLQIEKKRNLLQDRDEHGRTLLYIASKSGFYDTCKLLLQNGASVNEVQKDGSTPLHGAAYFGHALVVGLLLQHGATSDIKNNWGNSALAPVVRKPINANPRLNRPNQRSKFILRLNSVPQRPISTIQGLN